MQTKRRQEAQRDSPGQKVPPKQKAGGWGAVAKAADSLAAKSKAREDTARNKKVSPWAKGRRECVEEAAGAKDLEARNAAKTDKKQQGGSLKHKVWPASASMKMPKEDMSLAPKGKGK